MSQTASHPTFSTREAAPASATRFGQSIKDFIDALREGMAAQQRYESLRGFGVSHDQAITRALSETGFGS